MQIRFIVEDNGHKLLLSSFLPKGVSIQKVGSINEIDKNIDLALTKKVDIVVGVIDNDKRKPSFLLKYAELQARDNLVLMQKNTNSNQKAFVIVIDPAVDKFIMENAENAEIELPNSISSFDLFKKRVKTLNSDRDNELIQFISKIIRKKPAGFKTLADIINDIT